jgi:hypothetical protein
MTPQDYSKSPKSGCLPNIIMTHKYYQHCNFSLCINQVCSTTGKFTSVNASWPGSCHDSHVFRTSGLCQRLEKDNKSFSDGFLLGDSGYLNYFVQSFA